MQEEAVTPTIKTCVFERSLIYRHSQVILFCKKQTLTLFRRYRALLHMLHKPNACDDCKTCMGKTGKESEILVATPKDKKLFTFGPSVDEENN